MERMFWLFLTNVGHFWYFKTFFGCVWHFGYFLIIFVYFWQFTSGYTDQNCTWWLAHIYQTEAHYTIAHPPPAQMVHILPTNHKCPWKITHGQKSGQWSALGAKTKKDFAYISSPYESWQFRRYFPMKGGQLGIWWANGQMCVSLPWGSPALRLKLDYARASKNGSRHCPEQRRKHALLGFCGLQGPILAARSRRRRKNFRRGWQIHHLALPQRPSLWVLSVRPIYRLNTTWKEMNFFEHTKMTKFHIWPSGLDWACWWVIVLSLRSSVFF